MKQKKWHLNVFTLAQTRPLARNLDYELASCSTGSGPGSENSCAGSVFPKIRENVSYVIVNYEGSFFPGLVVGIKRTYFEVSCLVKVGPKQWRFPEKPDICDYIGEDIKEVIKTPLILNNRNIMRVPEVEKYWGEG